MNMENTSLENKLIYKTIGDRKYLIESNPLSIYEFHNSCIIVWGNKLYRFRDNVESGSYNGKTTYATCTLDELYGNGFFHTSPSECYKVVASDAKRLNKEYNLLDLN